MFAKPSSRSVAVAGAVGLMLTAVAAFPVAANAELPTVDTTPSITFTVPGTAPGADHTGLRVNLRTTPSNTIWVELRCDGYDPYLLDRSVPDASGVTTFTMNLWPALSGTTCTIKGSSPVGSQSVEFSPGTTVTSVKGVPATTVSGLVIVHSPIGGLF